MIKILVIWVLSSIPLCAFTAEVTKVELDADGIQQSINAWENTIIKQVLSEHFSDNKRLFEMISKIEGIQDRSEPEVDAIFVEEVLHLRQNQAGLNYFAENIISIANSEALDLDGFLSKRHVLTREYQNKLKNINGATSARMLVNRLLYLSLMAKYSNI